MKIAFYSKDSRRLIAALCSARWCVPLPGLKRCSLFWSKQCRLGDDQKVQLGITLSSATSAMRGYPAAIISADRSSVGTRVGSPYREPITPIIAMQTDRSSTRSKLSRLQIQDHDVERGRVQISNVPSATPLSRSRACLI